MLVTQEPITHTIGCVNWPDAYPDKPSVQFDISCIGGELHLGFRVREEAARAVCAKDKENIWEDSCVEFFFAPFDDGLYYNFECSCIGRLYLCCGSGREGSQISMVAPMTRQPCSLSSRAAAAESTPPLRPTKTVFLSIISSFVLKICT